MLMELAAAAAIGLAAPAATSAATVHVYFLRAEDWRPAQLVYTLTAVAGVDRVNLRLQGRLVRVLSGEGLLLRQPLRRSDYPEFIPERRR